VRQLERELGVTLFVRHRHGVELTDHGRRLLEAGRRVAAATSEFLDAARSVTGAAAQLRVGIALGVWEAVNRVRAAYTERRAEVAIEFKDVGSAAAYEQELRERTLDVVVARDVHASPHLHSAPLYQEGFVVVLHTDHPLARRRSLTISDVADQRLLLWDRRVLPGAYDTMLRLYARAGIEPETQATPGAGPYNQAGLLLVADGHGIYIGIDAPPTTARSTSGVAIVPLAERDASVDVSIVWRRDESSAAIREFVSRAREVFPRVRLVASRPQRAAAGAAGGVSAGRG
jgi:DNA-binding transcriptional LysR family regulator